MNCSMDELAQQLEKVLSIVRKRQKYGSDSWQFVFKLQLDILKDMLKVKP